jgi:UDP-glucose 4-epimerase
MRVLVTGGTGFIGRRLVAHLIERFGATSITCLVTRARKPSESEAAARFAAAGVTLIEGDLMQTPVSAVPPPPVDVVFHLAANIDTDAPVEEHAVNDQGTGRLLDWLTPIARGVRIVYTSSIAVLDRNGPSNGPVTEDSPCTPRTAYGVTKLRGEVILRERAAACGYTWTILRLPTVYGPGEKIGGLFDLMITSAREGTLLGRIVWPGRTSIIFIEDAAAILIDVGVRPDTANELYMVSSGEDCTLPDIAATAGSIVGRPVRPVKVPTAIWSFARWLLWHPVVRPLVPRRATVTYWRLTLIVDDGFWCDPSKLLRMYRAPLVQLPEGLRRTLNGS